ncbi:type IV secretion system protein [Sphingomonas faeni]|uniref:type IV secretion system protein n=1 Tax=Sphingomonas faeni TaxID=185950 RepID=UPI0020C78F9C|nr:type IV secretion system protein [Sphingomonas faeni]MCP8892283.1 type IV secretion system protein [Sphingomonas faeni]
MRNLKVFAVALAGSASMLAGSAHAQGIPVIDTSSIVQQIEQVRQGVQVLQQGAAQIQEAQKLYQDLNKATDIGNIANRLKSDVLRTSNVSSNSLGGYTSGDLNVVGGLRGKANEVYQDLIGRVSPTATAEQRAASEQGAREAAVTTGLASNVGDAVTSRRQGLEELRTRLNGSTSAAERADMTARLQLEQAQMMNDQLALQAIEIQRRAKAEGDYQKYLASQQDSRAAFRRDMGLN